MGSQEAERKTTMILLASFADNLKEMRSFAKKISALLFFGLLACPVLAFCQVDTAWVRRYNGLGDSTDEAHAIAVDDSGNVYVTGWSFGGAATDWDYVTLKYDRNGNELWVRRYNGSANSMDFTDAIVLDKSSNVYVTGESVNLGTNFDYVTIKYDSQGNQQWMTSYNGPINSVDASTALAIDSGGNIYVTGLSESTGVWTFPCGTDFDVVTIKYDPSGNRVWTDRYAGQGNSKDFPIRIVVDRNGNNYVAGENCDPTTPATNGFLIIKYSSSGNRLWVRRHNNSFSLSSSASSLQVDASGNVFVTGYTYNDTTRLDYTTIKYDSLGNLLWTARYNGPVDNWDWAVGLILDGSGNVYITGYSFGTGTDNDIATIKYDFSGNQLWVRRYNGPGNGADMGWAITLDTAGNIYIAGTSVGNGTHGDYVVLKYDSNGNLQWEMRYDGLQPSIDEAEAISVDLRGNVYVTGRSTGSSKPYDYDYATIKYSPLPALKGDLNLDGVLTMADVVLMLNFVFLGDPFPAAPTAGDLNCDGAVTPADFVIMLQIFFLSAPPPC